MNSLQKTFKAFIESTCAKYGCTDAIHPLQEGFSALCEAAFDSTGSLIRSDSTLYNAMYGTRVFHKPMTEVTKADVDSVKISMSKEESYLSRKDAVRWLSGHRAQCDDKDIWRVISTTPTSVIAAKDYGDECRLTKWEIVPVTTAGAPMETDPEWNMHPEDRKVRRQDRWSGTTDAVTRNRKRIPDYVVSKVENLAKNMGWKVQFEEDMDGRGHTIGDGFTFTRILASNEAGPDEVDAKMIDSVMKNIGFEQVDREVSDPYGMDQTVYEYTSYIYKDSVAHIDPDADDFYYERQQHPGDPGLQEFEDYSEARREERERSWGF